MPIQSIVPTKEEKSIAFPTYGKIIQKIVIKHGKTLVNALNR